MHWKEFCGIQEAWNLPAADTTNPQVQTRNLSDQATSHEFSPLVTLFLNFPCAPAKAMHFYDHAFQVQSTMPTIKSTVHNRYNTGHPGGILL